MFRLKIILVLLLIIWLIHDQVPDNNLHLVVCDVGQGDAILVSYRSWQLLVDGGRSSRVLSCLGKAMPFWDKDLEVLVATHPDADHIGGLDEVFQVYNVKRFVRTQDTKDTADFKRLIEFASREKAQGSTEQRPRIGDDLNVDPLLDVIVVFPQENQNQQLTQNSANSETTLQDISSPLLTETTSSKNDYNSRSIVLLLSYKSFSALLTGDLEVGGEQALLQSGMIKPITVLKVGHHGAKTSTSAEFVGVLRPEISIISVGKNNSYGHPSPQVIDLLQQNGSKVWRTDQMGTIEIITNGQWLKTANYFKIL